MNKLTLKLTAVIMVLVTLFCYTSLGASAAQTAYENDLPVVYLRGATEKVYASNGKQVWPMPKSITSMLLDNKTDLLTALTASVTTGDWSFYGEKLAETLRKYYKYAALDGNGNPQYGTHIVESETPVKKTENFKIGDYIFKYDPRLDPWETAKSLNKYINSVLAATGKSKVQLVSRCMGCCYASAYLKRYGSTKVDTAVYYASAAQGAAVASELFSGKVKLDASTLNTYAENYMGDDELSQLLSGVIKVTYSLSILGYGTDMVDEIFAQLAEEVFPQMLLDTFATMPAYWAMVGIDYYDEAREFVFSGKEKQYEGLLKKIDYYHKNVKVPLVKNLKAYRNNGMKIAVIAKYNEPFPPYIESSLAQGDGSIDMPSISFGAQGAGIDKIYSIDYLNQAKLNGTIDYISDDLMIDTTKCAFNRYTWFIKDIDHGTFPRSINTLIMTILHHKQSVSVYSYKKYPQFMNYSYDGDLLTPVEQSEASGDAGTTNPLLDLISKISEMFNMLVNLFKLFTK